MSNEETSLSKAKKALKETISWALTIIIALLVSVFFTRFVIFKAIVPTGSMKSTIMENDKLVGIQIFSSVNRGDIVIFPALNYSGEDVYYVKRVIGLPGETLEIKEGKVYINNKVLEEDYLNEAMDERNWGPYTVPEESYFVMGDNRNFSKDARFWDNKYVKYDDIVAKVFFRYSPSIKFYLSPQY